MCNENRKHFGGTLATLGAAFAVVLALMGANADHAGAQVNSVQAVQQDTKPLSSNDLEKTFWGCDYAATVRGVLATPVDVCSGATDDFKRARFGGDFEAMLKWWQDNKAAAHAELARDVQPAALETIRPR
jgi:hypothetical protein